MLREAQIPWSLRKVFLKGIAVGSRTLRAYNGFNFSGQPFEFDGVTTLYPGSQRASVTLRLRGL